MKHLLIGVSKRTSSQNSHGCSSDRSIGTLLVFIVNTDLIGLVLLR